MTTFWPCRRCNHRETCLRLKDMRKQLRGAGITKANVKCSVPASDFPPGATVDVQAFEMTEGGGTYDSYGLEKTAIVRRGVVREWTRGYAAVVLNADQEIRKFDSTDSIGYLKKVEPDRLTRVDVPIAKLCSCGLTAERCENGDHPSIRDGKWACAERLAEEFPA